MVLKGGSRRLFRTVLFTDIVGSTELAAQAGDRRWRRTLAGHHAAIRRELRRHHGREVDTAGDGFFAIFENPTDAVRCAAAAVAAVHVLGLPIRAGVHTGEVEQAGDKFGGIAVHIGARLLALSGAREVVVSSTVRDLVVGSGHEFEDRGAHELKGIPGEWRVYSLVLPRFEEGAPLTGVDEEELRAFAVRRQKLVIGGLVGVIAVLVAVLAGALFLGSRVGPLPSGADTVLAFDADNTAPQSAWRIGRGPEALALADGVLWAASVDNGTVTRIDLATGSQTSVGQAGTRPSAVTASDNRLWVADRYSSQIAVLDASDGSLLDRLELHASALASTAGQLWLTDDLGDRVIRLDPQTNAELAVIALAGPAGPSGIDISDSGVWVAAPRSGALLRIEAATGTYVDVAVDLIDVRVVRSLGADVWIASPTTDRIARLEGASGRVAVRVDVCDTPIALAPTPTAVWVACATERALWRIDRAGTVLIEIRLDAVPTAVVADGERVWVTLRAD